MEIKNYKIQPDPSNPGHHLCELCNRSFKHLKNCYRHYRTDHLKLNRRSRPSGEPYECKLCGEKFPAAYSLTTHVNLVHKGLTFKCPHCSRPFKSKPERVSHELVCPENAATRQKPVICKVCQGEFPGKERLQQHINSAHADIYTFPCKFCEKRFTDKYYLKMHVDSIHERKSCKCKICGMELSTVCGLRIHYNRIHLKKKPHACDICKKRFYRPYELKRHQRVAHLNKKFVCSVEGCRLEYNSKHSLKIHVLKVHGHFVKREKEEEQIQ